MIMKPLKAFTIPFGGLKQGEHHYTFDVERPFFEYFEYDDINDANITAALTLLRKATLLEFYFDIKGKVNVHCDLTNEPFDLKIETTGKLIVNFGSEYNNENEELLILPHGSYEINIQQYVYEFIVLSIPAKKVHPGVADGSLDSDMLKKLEEYSIDITREEQKNNTDPRWDSLKRLLTDK